MKTVAVVSAKGGVGKTTLCANLSAALGRQGHPVLAVDLDPQNALRFHLGLGVGSDTSLGIAEATLRGLDWREVCLHGPPGVSVAPYGTTSEDSRELFERWLAQDPAAVGTQLRRMALPDDTIVMLDTPPGASGYMRQALTCADLVVVVSLADAASYATLPAMHKLIHTYCGSTPGFVGYAYVINQVDRAKQLSSDVTELMRADLGDRVAGIVHQDQSIAEALAFNRNVLDYDQHCRGTHDILDTARAIASRLSPSRAAS